MENSSESLRRRIESGACLIGIVDHGLILGSDLYQWAQDALSDFSIVDIDARKSGAASSMVPIILQRLVSLAGVRGRWRVRKLATALAYVAASIATKATGVDFRHVRGGLRYADELVKPGVEENANRQLLAILKKLSPPVIFLIRNFLTRNESLVNELVLAARHISSLNRNVSFVFAFDSLSLDGRNAEILAPGGVIRFDALIHLPRTQERSIAGALTGSGFSTEDLNPAERRSIESYIVKASRLASYRSQSIKLTLHHVLSSREIWARETDFFHIVPFLLGLKYHNAALYSRLVERHVPAEEVMGAYPSTRPYLDLMESEVRGTFQVSNGDNVTAVFRRMILSIEKRGI